MKSSTVLSNQLIPFVLRAAKIDEPLVVQIIERIPDADFDHLSALLAEMLREEAHAGRLTMTNPATGEVATLNSILFKSNSDSSGVKVVAFSFVSAAHESLVAVFGLVVTAFLGQWAVGSLSGGLTVLKSLWSNLSVLRSPQDDHAIHLVKTFGICRANDGEDPTNARLQEESGLATSHLVAALKQLDAYKIVKNIAWGGQSGDLAHLDNRWTIRF